MKSSNFYAAFSAGALLHQESIALAELYLSGGSGNWLAVRDQVKAENMLQKRTVSTLQRTAREVVTRLKCLSDLELRFLIEASHQEQAYLLWVAMCRRYQFVADFAVEVLRERYITLKADLHHEDFDVFFNRKSEWHTELESIAPTTRGKLRRVLFRALREADFLDANYMIDKDRLY